MKTLSHPMAVQNVARHKQARKFGFVQLSNELVDRVLSLSKKLSREQLYAFLWAYRESEGWNRAIVFASYSEIAQRILASASSVKKALTALVARNILLRFGDPTGGKRLAYAVNADVSTWDQTPTVEDHGVTQTVEGLGYTTPQTLEDLGTQTVEGLGHDDAQPMVPTLAASPKYNAKDKDIKDNNRAALPSQRPPIATTPSAVVPSVKMLQEIGMETRTAEKLSARFNEGLISAAIARANEGSRKNKAGWVRAALEKGWVSATSVATVSPEAQERKRALRFQRAEAGWSHFEKTARERLRVLIEDAANSGRAKREVFLIAFETYEGYLNRGLPREVALARAESDLAQIAA